MPKVPVYRPLFLKRGVLRRGTLERALRNQSRNSSSCSKKPVRPKCPLPDPTTCEPPSVGGVRPPEDGPPQVAPCMPDCSLDGEPNLPPRGCLPWEKGVEMCPAKVKPRKLETECCEHICEPYLTQGIVDKLKMSTCDFRRFERCFKTLKNAERCGNLEPNTPILNKEYPMMHAVHKKYLPGCPINLPKFVSRKTVPQCED